MAHSLASPPPAVTAAKTPISSPATTSNNSATRLPSLGFPKVRASYQVSDNARLLNHKLVHRRTSVGLGLVGALVAGLSASDPNGNANAAARRPPPPPAEEKEKRDPNVSGVLAKVLASKKRKEAMKETVAKLRDKGKPIQE